MSFLTFTSNFVYKTAARYGQRLAARMRPAHPMAKLDPEGHNTLLAPSTCPTYKRTNTESQIVPSHDRQMETRRTSVIILVPSQGYALLMPTQRRNRCYAATESFAKVVRLLSLYCAGHWHFEVTKLGSSDDAIARPRRSHTHRTATRGALPRSRTPTSSKSPIVGNAPALTSLTFRRVGDWLGRRR